MKEIIEKILTYLPRYFEELGEVCTTPKTFAAERDVNSDETFAASLLFLAISLVLQTLILAPLNPPGRDLWTELGSVVKGIFTFAVVDVALALWIFYRKVGAGIRCDFELQGVVNAV
jgi:hypothetical protein